MAPAAELAVMLVDGCDAAGLVAVDHERRISSASHSIVTELAELQVATSEGPCIEAMALGGTILAPDVGEDRRWPRFGPAAARAGFRSALATQLSDQPSITLTVYSREPAAFGVIDRDTGAILAALGGLAIDIVGRRVAGEQRVANLYEAIRTRELIGQAQGILIERHGLTGDEAFAVLRQSSQQRNIKLLEVARTLVETGETPPSGTSRRRVPTTCAPVASRPAAADRAS